jgi:hypothetical protein
MSPSRLGFGSSNLMSPPIFPRVPPGNRSINSANRIGIADNQCEIQLPPSRSSTPSNILPSSFSTFSPPTLLLPISTSRSSSPRSVSPIVSMLKITNKKRERSRKAVVLPLKFSKNDSNAGFKTNSTIDDKNNMKMDNNNSRQISSINTDFSIVKLIQDESNFISPGSITQIKSTPTIINTNGNNYFYLSNISFHIINSNLFLFLIGMNNIPKPNSTSPPISCNCKRSKCLKLYCDCFKNQKYCDGCHCVNCSNTANTETSEERRKAIEGILERSADAFKPRVNEDQSNSLKAHLSGCHCKKSNCLKKYCECYSGSVSCALRCRCIDCKNINIFNTKFSEKDEEMLKESMKETIEVLLDIK